MPQQALGLADGAREGAVGHLGSRPVRRIARDKLAKVMGTAALGDTAEALSLRDSRPLRVGLGETMTPKDLLEDILRLTVLVAISRPAEFIEITFQQSMEKS